MYVNVINLLNLEGENIMDWSSIISSILDNILVPVLVLIGSTIVLMLKPFAKKITSSIQMKNEMAALEKMTKAKGHLMEQLDGLVDTAVAANMQLAEKMKENGHKLTPDEIEELNNSAKEMVIDSLPTEILDPEGDLYKLIGGEEKLDRMIKNLMEKHVYAYKLKKPPAPPVQMESPVDQGDPSVEEIPMECENEDSTEYEGGDMDGDSALVSEPEVIHSLPVVHNPVTRIKPPSRFGIE